MRHKALVVRSRVGYPAREVGNYPNGCATGSSAPPPRSPKARDRGHPQLDKTTYETRAARPAVALSPQPAGRIERNVRPDRIGGPVMDENEIIAIVRKRRDNFFDAQIAGTAEDPLEYSAASVNMAIADEYDSLLLEIQGQKPE